jgi:hypothetical protein
MKRFLIAPIVLLLSACAHQPADALTGLAAEGSKSEIMQTYGANMPTQPAAKPLTLALQHIDAPPVGPTKISGRVGAVCQVKGCWMMLTDGDNAVRVKFGDDAFFIPKDAQGEAVVYGVLEEVKMSAAEAKHLADDAGVVTTAKAAMPAKEYRVIATSVLLTQSMVVRK